MSNQRNASQNAMLVLRTIDSTASTSNTVLQFNNISFRQLLGNGMYDKYDLFNISVIQIATDICNVALGYDTNDLLVSLSMSGLDFQNQTYNSKTGNFTNNANIGVVKLTRSDALIQNFYSNNTMTFRKKDFCNITINLKKFDDSVLNANGVNYPNITILFNIVGIPA
jgi:hypothetical protein